MSRRLVRDGIVGALAFVAVLTAFFFAWAAADAIRPTRWAGTLFSIVSFPIFTIAPRGLAHGYFWELAILDCMLWAAVVVWLMRLWKPE